MKVLKELDGWKIVDNQLSKEFKFKGFIQAFGFMTEVAITAENYGSPSLNGQMFITGLLLIYQLTVKVELLSWTRS